MEFYRAGLKGLSDQLKQVAARMTSKEIGSQDGDQKEFGNLLAMTRREVESVPVPPEMVKSYAKRLTG
jgi:hypothetical protein